jgi:DNA polymerase III epsilon subunit-like protein
VTAPLAFIDVETTGTDPRWHDAWDLGIVYADGAQVEYQFPVDLTHADPVALRIGGYYERHLGFPRPAVRWWKDDTTIDGSRRPQDASSWLTDAAIRTIATRLDGATLIGVNPQFDAAFITKILRSHGFEPTWQYRLIDLNSMARGHLLGLDRNPDSSGTGARIALDMTIGSKTLSDWCGVDRPNDHTALGDARWARDWYQAITSEDS